MRNRWQYYRPVCEYLGLLVGVFGALMLVPLGVRNFLASSGAAEVGAHVYWIPGLVALAAAVAMKRNLRLPSLDNRRAMLLCALGWIVVSAIGALPFRLGLGVGFLDAYFETVSGFTTTGITMLSGLDVMPLSILFWRSFIQWLGGLGILTFFLVVLYVGRSTHSLFGAESHKVFAKRPAPSLFSTLRILWLIYAAFTIVAAGALRLEGMSLFDAAAHSMTALSTGGYSPHDQSIAFYAGFGRAALIEYTLIAGMLLGGISFFVHYRLLTGGLRALWDSLEMRLWWILVAGATAVVLIDHYATGAPGGVETFHRTFRHCLFQVVSLLTTTGFATRDIGTDYFPAASKQIFLVLMVIGGCVGSTSGGVKVLRVGILLKTVSRQIRRLIHGPAAVHPVVVNGEDLDPEELYRVGSLFFAWMALLA
ncbi:MAG: TrkH family potassium uptake protein, partial [Planctomycetota bacterium]